MVFNADRASNIELVMGLASDFNLGAIIIDGAEAILQGVDEADILPGADTPSGPQPGGLMLSARQCVELAMQQNPLVDVAANEVEAANARVGQARSALFPQLGRKSKLVLMTTR